MYQLEGHTVVFPNGKRFRLQAEVAETIDYEDALVIRVSYGYEMNSNQNVMAFDYRGNLLWQIPSRVAIGGFSPYVSISRRGSFVDAFNWDGHTVTIDAIRGSVVGESFTAMGGSGSRRTASRRIWI